MTSISADERCGSTAACVEVAHCGALPSQHLTSVSFPFLLRLATHQLCRCQERRHGRCFVSMSIKLLLQLLLLLLLVIVVVVVVVVVGVVVRWC